jgi:hypothetical protein
MKINVFRTQAKIGSIVRYKGKEYKLADLEEIIIRFAFILIHGLGAPKLNSLTQKHHA